MQNCKMYVHLIQKVIYQRLYVSSSKIRTWLLVTTLSCNILFSTADKVLSINHVRNFEPVYYDHEEVHRQHHMAKRSTAGRVQLDFKAFDILFKTRLKRDTSVFHPNVVIETSHGTVPYDVTRTYTGTIEGVQSRVHGLITSTGQFEGKITIGNESYYVERSQHHFTEPQEFHSVIYKQSDVTFSPSESTCGVDRLYEAIAHDQVFSGTNDQRDNWELKYMDSDHLRRLSAFASGQNAYINNNEFSYHRNRRAVDPTKVTCEMYMQADHLYYRRYYNNTDTVIEKLTQHVQAINSIFKVVDFDNNGSPDNVNFITKKIKVHNDPATSGYKYDGNFGVETFLDLHSGDNYDDYCLSYLFTDRDFGDGVLGLAWVGDTSAAGGVCEKNTEFHGVPKSLNTGIVTIKNYNKEVPSAVSHVTFAHEVGHNFGSPHDPDTNDNCSPGGNSGNYIMYAYATSGDQANNDDFSSCSVGSINSVIDLKARGDNGCFVPNIDSICGNKIVEGDEECDCGWDTECTEGCCNPQTNTPGAETPCTKKSTAVCSPSQGGCCTSSCQYRLAAENYSCRQATDCLDEAFCDGANYNSTCPPSTAKANATACGNSHEDLVCYKGECTGSVCLAYGRNPCYCTATVEGNWKDEKLCQVCCNDDNGDCISSYELNDVPNASVVAGTPCNDRGGYCDVYQKCRALHPEGPLSNLKKLFLDGTLVNEVKQFLTQHWYIGLAAGLGFVIMIGLVVKFCRKTHKPPDDDETWTPGPAGRNQILPERY